MRSLCSTIPLLIPWREEEAEHVHHLPHLLLTLAHPHRLHQHHVVAPGLHQQDGLVGVPDVMALTFRFVFMAYIGPLIVSLNEYPGPDMEMESYIYIYSVNLLPRFSGWKEKIFQIFRRKIFRNKSYKVLIVS